MASISEITQAASYRGDPALGGHIATGLVIDPTPIQRFATFQYYQDKDMWEQKQKDDAAAAKQIASIAAFDISSPLTPYSDALKAKLQGIQDKIKNNKDALSYSKDPQGFQDLYKDINDFGNLRQAATASDAVYNAKKNKIDTEPDLDRKAYMQKELDTSVSELFEGGVEKAQNKILSSAAPLNPDDYKMPSAKITSYDAITTLPNENVTSHFKYINPDLLKADSELLAATQPPLDETTPAFKSLSPARQELERQRNALAGVNRRKNQEMASSLNDMLGKWREQNPGVDITKITGEPTGKDTLLDIIKSANKYNAQIEELNGMLSAGKSTDPTGQVITHKFDTFNLSDGISDAELIQLHTLQESGASIFNLTKTVAHTGTAVALDEHAVQRRGQDITRLNSKEGHGVQMAIAKMRDKQETAKLDAKGGGAGAQTGAIADVYEYMMGHISTIDQKLKNDVGGVSKPGDNVEVKARAADAVIRQALELPADGSYKQYRDGKITVLDADGKVLQKLNLNILKQKVAVAMHGTKSGDVDAKSQEAIEKAFGLKTDLNKILQEEGKAKPAAAAPATQPVALPVNKSSQIDTGALEEGKSYSFNGKSYTWDGENLVED